MVFWLPENLRGVAPIFYFCPIDVLMVIVAFWLIWAMVRGRV
jgi:hypothetical protein